MFENFQLPEEMQRMCRRCFGNEGGDDLDKNCKHQFAKRETWVSIGALEAADVRSTATAITLLQESCCSDWFAARKLTPEEIMQLRSGDYEIAVVVRRKTP